MLLLCFFLVIHHSQSTFVCLMNSLNKRHILLFYNLSMVLINLLRSCCNIWRDTHHIFLIKIHKKTTYIRYISVKKTHLFYVSHLIINEFDFLIKQWLLNFIFQNLKLDHVNIQSNHVIQLLNGKSLGGNMGIVLVLIHIAPNATLKQLL